MSALIKSIEDVSGLIVRLATAPMEPATPDADFSHLIRSIKAVSESYKVMPENETVEPELSMEHLVNSIKVVSLSALEKQVPIEFSRTQDQTLLSFLDKEDSENFHSDFIASFLDVRKSGDLAREFFRNLIQFATGDEAPLPRIVSVRREITLSELVPGIREDIGSRRIDVLAHSEEHIIVIENKVKSFESVSQTSDYHEVVKQFNENLIRSKKVVEIFLSPRGDDPDCNSYRPMTYRDLFAVLSSIHKGSAETQRSRYLSLYLESLFETYFKTDSHYQKFIREFWRIHER